MSKDDFIEDGSVELEGGLDAETGDDSDSTEPEVSAKKSSLPMMAAVGVGVAAVVGFAGFQVYNKMFAGPPAPMMDVGIQAAPVQPAPVAQSPVQAAPVSPAALEAPVAVQQPSALPPALPAALDPQAPALPAVAVQPMASPQVLAGAGVDMTAVMELKVATEAQAKKVAEIEDKITSLEQRILALESGKSVKSSKSSKAATSAEGEGASPVAKTSVKKVATKASKKLAKKVKDKEASAKSGSGWKTKSVEKSSGAIARSRAQLLEKLKAAEATVASNAKSADAVLPPSPDFGSKPASTSSAPSQPSEAKVQPIASPQSSAVVTQPKIQDPQPAAPVAKPVTVSGLKVQAVIPGRVWLSDGNGPTRSYAIGDVVRAGVVIRSIDADSAVVTTSAGVLK